MIWLILGLVIGDYVHLEYFATDYERELYSLTSNLTEQLSSE